jgi:hypothetical protein
MKKLFVFCFVCVASTTSTLAKERLSQKDALPILSEGKIIATHGFQDNGFQSYDLRIVYEGKLWMCLMSDETMIPGGLLGCSTMLED